MGPEPVPDGRAVIRPARAADADRVWPLAREFATSFELDRAAFEATWTQLVDAPHTLLVVAEVGPDLVGYLVGSSHLTFLANGRVAWVEELMVEQASRRSGIGRRLVDRAEEWARASGAAYLALATRRAAPFYRALGYDDSATFFRKTLS